MNTYFPGISKVAYEGAKSTNPLAFRYYNPEEIVAGKTDARAAQICAVLLAHHVRRRHRHVRRAVRRSRPSAGATDGHRQTQGPRGL